MKIPHLIMSKSVFQRCTSFKGKFGLHNMWTAPRPKSKQKYSVKIIKFDDRKKCGISLLLFFWQSFPDTILPTSDDILTFNILLLLFLMEERKPTTKSATGTGFYNRSNNRSGNSVPSLSRTNLKIYGLLYVFWHEFRILCDTDYITHTWFLQLQILECTKPTKKYLKCSMTWLKILLQKLPCPLVCQEKAQHHAL